MYDKYKLWKDKFNSKSMKKNKDDPNIINQIRSKFTHQIKTIIKNQIILGKEKKSCSCHASNLKEILHLFLKIFRILISIYALVLYVASTYYDDNDDNNNNVILLIYYSEIIIALFISLDIGVSTCFKKNKMRYLTNYLIIMDIITVAAIFISISFKGKESLNLGFTRILRLIRIMRTVKFLNLYQSPGHEICYNLINKIFNILAILFLYAGLIHYLANSFPSIFYFNNFATDNFVCVSGQNISSDIHLVREGYVNSEKCPYGDQMIFQLGNFTFDIAFYYTVITMTTIGYGDIIPGSNVSRIIISFLLFIFIVFFTLRINQLNDLMKVQDSLKVPFSGENHIIIGGKFSKLFIFKFLCEFNQNNILEKKKILIISQDHPSLEIQKILDQYEGYISCYVGELFNEQTIQDCKIEKSSYIFLISDSCLGKTNTNDNYLDIQTFDRLIILACKFFSQFSFNAKICCQFKTSNNLLHNWANWDIGFSSQQIKNAMICRNGYIDGFITMISNLITKGNNFYSEEMSEVPWISEYVNGASNKIYIVKLTNSFFIWEYKEQFKNKEEAKTKDETNQIVNEKFINYNELVKKLNLHYDVLIIGIKTRIKSRQVNEYLDKIILNPFDYKIMENDELIVITCDLENLEKILNNNYSHSEDVSCSSKVEINANMFNLEIINKKEQEDIITINKNRYFRIWEDNSNELNDHMKDHFLLICPEEKIEEFMTIFQILYDDWIFYVSDSQPNTIWENISAYFPKLIYIETSFSDIEDLKKLNINGARHIFIFSWKVFLSSDDSGILPIVKMIEENFPQAKYTIELEDEHNLTFLNNFQDFKLDEENFQRILRKSSAEKTFKDFINVPIRIWPKYAKSDIFFTSFLHSLPAVFYHSPDILEIISKILGIYDLNYLYGSLIEEKNEFQENAEIGVYIYKHVKRIKYQDICRYFLDQKDIVLPIGIYRSNDKSSLHNPHSFIVTNPKKSMVIQNGDKIICFGKKIKDEINKKDSENEARIKNLSKDFNKLLLSKGYKENNIQDEEDEISLLKKIENEFGMLKILNGNQIDLKELSYSKNFSSELNKLADEKIHFKSNNDCREPILIEDYDNYESEKKEEDNSETNNFSKSYLNLLENNTQSKSVKRTLFFHSNEKGKKIKEGKKCRTMIDMNNSKDYLNNSFDLKIKNKDKHIEIDNGKIIDICLIDQSNNDNSMIVKFID